MKHMTIAEGLMVMVACMATAVTGLAGVREDTIPFTLQFTGTPAKPAMRPFSAGPVGEVTP
jgi:hypothetical protein